MQATFTTAELSLHKGQTLELGSAARSVITGICGAVWLTRDGDLNDRVIEPGQSLVVARDSHILLSAFGEARVRIEQKGRRRRGVAARAGRNVLAAYLRALRALKRRQGKPGNASLAY